MADSNAAATTPHIRRVAVASLVGTTIEWYDFFIYGVAAALVFGTLFFPSFSPLAGTLAAFATFAVGFFARPLGGIVMGHFGDRVGRKKMLVTSLLLMGIATFLIGLLPTYEQIGFWAPLLLVVLRFLQGFGVGGEWGGAVLIAVEHAPPRKRGFYGSFPQMGVPAGIVLSNLVILAVNATVPESAFVVWGWRVPFLLSILLVVVGIFVRFRIAESPYFEQLQSNRQQSRMPVLDVVRNDPKQVLLAAGTFIGNNGIGYIFIVYVLSYMTTVTGLPRSQALAYVLIAAVVWLVTITPFSGLSDRVGRRKVFLAGAAATAAWTVAFFPLIDTGSVPLILIALIVMATALSAAYGPQAALFSELFKTHVRYSGASLGYQLGAILGGGLAPFVATSLYGATGSSLAITGYMLLIALVSLGCVIAISDSWLRNLDIQRAQSEGDQAGGGRRPETGHRSGGHVSDSVRRSHGRERVAHNHAGDGAAH